MKQTNPYDDLHEAEKNLRKAQARVQRRERIARENKKPLNNRGESREEEYIRFREEFGYG